MSFINFYHNYFNKVRNLVLPLLDIPRFNVNGCSPEVFLNKADGEDTLNTVIYLFPKECEKTYKDFENKYILKNKNLIDFSSDEYYNKYIFSVKDVIDDFILIKSGNYTKLNKITKQKIKQWHSFSKRNVEILNFVLDPTDKDFKDCAEALNVSKDLLKSIGEIASGIDHREECISDENYKKLINKLKQTKNATTII